MTLDRDHFRTPLFTTPFYARTAALCQTGAWAPWAGYRVVSIYEDKGLEYFAIRNRATLFDLSPMVKYRVTGPEAEAYLNRLTLRDVTKLPMARVHYTAWCDDDGHVLDDGTLFRFAPDRFRLCCQERHLPWLLDSAIGFDVEVADETDDIAALALQGPTSAAVLRHAGFDIDMLKPFDMADYPLDGGAAVTISRTGFTGDLGYELWVGPAHALALWDRLWEAGGPAGIRPIGSAALNMARIEAGFIMANADFVPAGEAVRVGRPRSPFELGLGWMVDFDKGHFNGRRALLAERDDATSRYCLVGLEIDGNVPAEQALVYHGSRREVGHVTAAMWSPTAKRNIALAVLKRPYGLTRKDGLWVEIYALRELDWHKLTMPARVVDRPFFDPPRRRATPPSDF